MKANKAKDMMNVLSKDNRSFVFIIDFELENCKVFPFEDLPSEIKFKTPSFSSPTDYISSDFLKEKIDFSFEAVPFDKYKEAFDKVQSEINSGNAFLLNLTFPSLLKMSLSLKDIYYLSEAPYKLLYYNDFIFFSPEKFVEINNGIIKTAPMKGTIKKDLPNAVDLLLKNEKETSEHNTTIDLLRNDLSINASNVHVSKYKFISEIKTNRDDLLQMSSEITAKLDNSYREKIGDIIFSMLPAGSITGAPKAKTIEIIKKIEAEKRGYYTGVFGYYNDGYLDSAVMIRFIERRGEECFFRSGCGITALSKLEDEYKELIDKIYLPI